MTTTDLDDLEVDTSGVSASSLFKPEDPSALPAMPAGMRQRVEEKQAGEKAAAESKEPAEENIAINPLTGSIVYLDDIDSVIAGCSKAKDELAELRSHERLLRERAASFTSGDAKTRRIQGHSLRAKVEMPDLSWDQSVLKEAWNSFPQFRDEYLKIGIVDVKLREFKKLANLSTSDAAFRQFKGMLERANRGPQGLPSVTIEE